MTDQSDPTTVPAKEFAAFLVEQNKGKTHQELSDGLRDLVARVEDTRKKGSLTLVVTVEPMKDSEDALIVSDKIKLDLPEHARGASIFFRGADGNLQRNDPNQPSFFDDLRDPPAPRGVNMVTGETSGDYEGD